MSSYQDLKYFEEVSKNALQLGTYPIPKPEFYSKLQEILFHEQNLMLPSSLIKYFILMLRLIGLLKRKYYQATFLGNYFLALNLNITSYLGLFQSDLTEVLSRSQTEKVSSEQFFQIYITCGKWYIHIMKSKGFSGSDFLEFLSFLRFAFEWTHEIPTTVEESAQRYLNDYLQQEYRKRIAKQGETHFLPQSVRRLRERSSILRFPSPTKIESGKVLKVVLYDIYSWMITSLLNKNERFYAYPYFDISQYAKKANHSSGILIQNYSRMVKWILQKRDITPNQHFFLENLGLIQDWGISVSQVFSLIRKSSKYYHVKISPQRKRQVLVFKATKDVRKTQLYFNTKILSRVCKDCIYFEQYKKRDCLLFRRLELLNKIGRIGIPSEIKVLYKERIKPLFSTRMACSFWRPSQPYQISVFQTDSSQASCVHCHQPLVTLPMVDASVTCTCETEYHYISAQKAKYGIYTCQPSSDHSMGHDLAILNPLLQELAINPFKDEEIIESLNTQLFNLEINSSKDLLQRTSQYVFIAENSKLLLDPKQDLLKVDHISYDLRKISLIDTQINRYHWKKNFLKKVQSYTHLKINFRPFNITLSPEDRAQIDKLGLIVPVLKVKRPRKKEIETYPLHQLSVVFNVGKPRLTKLLKQWNVKVIYTSTKGISPTPQEEIRKSIELPGVRPTLQKLHLQGLLISIISASIELIDRMMSITSEELKILKGEGHSQDLTKLEVLAANLKWRMKSLLSQETITIFPQNVAHPSAYKRAGLIEARFSRPFSEEIRNFIDSIQNPDSPFLLRGYGRTVARRVKKRHKQGQEYMGGYTPFDAALNCLNRSIRYKLRVWNAKEGLGFHTVPLFVHRSKDKPGRAGHLDLEEVARLIARFALMNSILSVQIRSSDFQIAYDDDFLPFYIPSSDTVTKLRYIVVYRMILQTRIFYQGKWTSLGKAHKKHIKNLCLCLKNAIKIQDEQERIIFLEKMYQPLIYLPEINKSRKKIFSEFRNLLTSFISDPLLNIFDYFLGTLDSKLREEK